VARYPVRGCTSGSEGSFEGAMYPLHYSICLRVKGSGVDVGNIEEGGKGSPEGGCELGTSV
jgi:hypothetical protein